MHIKKKFYCDFPRSQIRLHQSQKLAIDDIFIYSWRDLTPLLHVHLEITKKNLIIFDAIKASVPKFLNFLGAELNNNCITHLEGWTLLLAENNDQNQIFKKFTQLPKIRFKVAAWIMQKDYFCPEENTKPSHCNCATFYTKLFY